MKNLNLTLLLLFLAVISFAQNVPSYVPTNGLVGWWPFNGNANDESGNGNNGTAYNASYDIDRMGNPNQSLLLSGVNNTPNGTYVTVNGSDFNLTNDMSFSVWFRSTNGEINPMIEKKLNKGYSIYTATGDINPIGHHSFVFNDQGFPWQTFDQYHAGTFSSIDGDWHHLVVTFTLNLGIVTMYIDGMFDSQSNLNTGGNSSNTEDLKFGLWDRNGNKFFNGNLDDIGIWNRALTQQEITDLYNGNICYQTITVTDTLLINTGITGFNPVTYENTIRIWPNPTNDHITIDAGDLNIMNGYSIRITNSLGQQMFQSTINQQQFYLDLSSWTGNGIYYVNIINPQGVTIDTKKIVIQ